MTTSVSLLCRRTLAATLSFLIALGPVATPAYAQLTRLADEPIGFKPTASPNIVLTIDDSTSMLSDFLPDYIVGTPPGSTGTSGFCRDGSGVMNAACGTFGSPTIPAYIYSASGVPYPTYAAGYASSSSIPDWHRAWPAPVHNNALNRIYYDPSLDYTPAKQSDGSLYPVSPVNNAVADPWASTLRYVNLTGNVNVGLYCNSDWPLNTLWDPAATGGGDHCRINGTDYSAKLTAPETGDYQYPWTKSSTLTSPLPAAEEKYFWRNGGNFTVWCDRRNANLSDPSYQFPQSCTTPVTGYTCSSGTYVPPPTVPQSCFLQGTRMGCDPAVDTDFSPVGCQRSPLYGGGGSPGLCSGGPECLPCSCNNTRVIGKNANCRLASSAPPGSGGSNASCGCTNSPIGTPCSLGSCPAFTGTGVGTCTSGVTPTPVTGTPVCTALGGVSCSTRLFNPATRANDGPTIFDDSNTNGIVCRHNNQSYPDGTVANRRNYHSGHVRYRTAVSGGTGCGGVPPSASVPRHYWKTSVEWCTARVTAADDKWRGFGQAGSCQDDHDNAHPYPRYYKWGVPKSDPAYADNYTYPAFERVDIASSLTNCSAESRAQNPGAYCSHRYWKSGAWVQTDRSYAQEAQNYANWFSYYRTRILAAKTVISQNFQYLDDNYRLAFHTLNNGAGTFLDFAAFTPAHKSNWYNRLFGVAIPMGQQTPIISAMTRIGDDFASTGGNPALPGSANPITLSCQKNYHMLFTDGIVNQPALPSTTVGNQDNTVLSLPQPLVVTPPIVVGSAWPPLYQEDTLAPTSNSMADYAMYYWVTDLRPAMTDNVPTGRDPAMWQHVNFAALSLGTEGILTATSPTATEARIAAGTLEWPSPTPNTWNPTSGGVDDLWHAAVNARGRFVNAKNSIQLGRGIAEVLADIDSPSGTNVPATFVNPNLSITNNYTYIAEFVQGWGGKVRKVQVDPTSAAVLSNIWDTEVQLTAQTNPTVAMPTPWNTNRRIVTANDSGTAAVPFTPATISGAQLATLGPGLGYQTSVVEFLRGRRDNEGQDDGQFRQRVSPLGDIVDSQPVYVGPPLWAYQDAYDAGYSAFRATHSARPGRLYVGANDGMLHAFDDVTGNEAWAFVPRDFYRNPPNDKAGLIGLSYQPGGLPIYSHRFYVNATPRVVDVDFTCTRVDAGTRVCNGSGDWHTLLVGGLGKGGASYYALDITDPSGMTDEGRVAATYRWEFRDPDLGYTYGKPIIVKTFAHGWVVIVSSGYNNPSGVGKLYFLRASDGTLLKTMCTGSDGGSGCSAPVGTAARPIGFAHFAGYVKDYRNQIVEQIYGGDLYGNVWRFDVSDPNPDNWVTAKFAVLTSDGVAVQPVTTPPQIEIDVQNGVDRWVFFGTGKLLHPDDLSDTSTQSLYALRDGTGDQPWPITAPLTRSDLSVVSGIAGLGSNVIPPRGWVDDLTAQAGERIVTPLQAAISLVGYITSAPATDPCDKAQPARIYVRYFGNGASALVDDVNSPTEFLYEPEGGAGIDIVALQGACTVNCIPDIRIVITTKSGQVKTAKVTLPGILGQNRLSWRGVGQ